MHLYLKNLSYLALLLFAFSFSSCKKENTGNPPADTTKVTPSKPPVQNIKVSTIAGTLNSYYGRIEPEKITTDANGNLYIYADHALFRVDSKNNLTHLAGKYGTYGFIDEGTGEEARFRSLWGIVCDDMGNIYGADSEGRRICKVTPGGVVSTFAGSKIAEIKDGTGLNASFNAPQGIQKGPDGNFYISDGIEGKLFIRKITKEGVVTTVTTLPSQFAYPPVFAIASDGDFYMAFFDENQIYKYSKSGVLSLFAGSGQKGSNDGVGTSASFESMIAIAVDRAGYVYVTEVGGSRIRRVSPNGEVVTLASGPQFKKIISPNNMAIDAAGNVLMASWADKVVYRLNPTGTLTAVYGKVDLNSTTTALSTSFNKPSGIAVDASDNIYITDAGNNVVRKLSSGVVSTLAGNGEKGAGDGTGVAVSFDNPLGVSINGTTLYVADFGNNKLRKILSTGQVSSIALDVTANGASGPENNPTAVTSAANGYIYYTNTRYNTICAIKGSITSTFSYGTYTGQAFGKFYNHPNGVAVDKNGIVYIADTKNHRIIKTDKNGRETIVAGSSTAGNFPVPGSNDGIGMAASFNNPKGLTVDSKGNIYVADTGNNLIRKITPDGMVTTVAGLLVPGAADGDVSVASFNEPYGITLNTNETALYVADSGNNLIRKITL